MRFLQRAERDVRVACGAGGVLRERGAENEMSLCKNDEVWRKRRGARKEQP